MDSVPPPAYRSVMLLEWAEDTLFSPTGGVQSPPDLVVGLAVLPHSQHWGPMASVRFGSPEPHFLGCWYHYQGAVIQDVSADPWN